jgi:hypothetical protein
MELNEKILKNILNESLEYFEKSMDSKMHDAIHGAIKEQREEFSREVGVMFEDVNSKMDFVVEKVIGIEEKLDTRISNR